MVSQRIQNIMETLPHNKIVYNAKTPFKCSLCGETFNCKKLFLQHLINAHSDKVPTRIFKGPLSNKEVDLNTPLCLSRASVNSFIEKEEPYFKVDNPTSFRHECN